MRGIMDDLNTSVPPLSSYSGIASNTLLLNERYHILFHTRGKMGPGGGGQGEGGGGGGAYTHPHR